MEPKAGRRGPTRGRRANSRGKTRTRVDRGSAGAGRLVAAQKAIGNFLRATRAAQRLTQQQVAAMTQRSPWQLSRAAISAIERGQNFPGMEAMLALSNVLYVDPKELVERARMSTLVPVDVTGLAYDDLERRASDYFWAGEFRKALSVYDAMLEKLALEPPGRSDAASERLATLEVRRATTLKRAGALISAIASAERAISLSVQHPEIQTEAYVVLADLQCQRGHLPLAGDAAQRAVELAKACAPRTRGWAWMVRGRVHFLAGAHAQAEQAFLEARRHAMQGGDHRHLTHIEGNLAMCCLAMGRVIEARRGLERAIELARRHGQPALEASWLVELGKVALRQRQAKDADRHAQAALRIAKPREHFLTVFRAEWLRHRVVRELRPRETDRHRLAQLRKLLLQLDQHEGIDEVREFKEALLLSSRETEEGKGR